MDKAETDLSKKMRAAADKEGYAADHEMRVLADKFDAAAQGFYSSPQTVSAPSFLGHFARARKCWCNYSGEPLV